MDKRESGGSGALPASQDRAVVNGAGHAVSALRASVPSAEWPCWAVVGTHEEFRSGSRATVVTFRWAFAPSEDDALFGRERELRELYPGCRNLEVFARQVPAQAIEARRAETQSGSVHESAVGNADAPCCGEYIAGTRCPACPDAPNPQPSTPENQHD